MILTEFLNDGTLIKHYSDKGVLLLQNETGAKYGEAIDVVPCRYTYIETEELVEKEDNNEYREDYRIIPENLTTEESFAKDEYGWWNDELYKSLVEANVYNPSQYPAGWEKAG